MTKIGAKLIVGLVLVAVPVLAQAPQAGPANAGEDALKEAEQTAAQAAKLADESSAALMTKLYQQLSAGGQPAEALRAAQLSLAQQAATSHPYHWAAFEVIAGFAAGAGAG